ncbi:DUF6402 family protein [Paraburkholderia sp. MMS20-SJTR3]|uniref:DUF6402 family protein n=1 Tax=Paraburkholderia sejongensis TaxID=2886946 RepID=A0ABS8JUP8_9BURK|nr:DUF6402 family protein [Paraburkholderia sp. MMS20-SJTR3]MCC8393622.1 DUF6402 family protein [Paraburkholderia sp. MMS20-SJTR3]
MNETKIGYYKINKLLWRWTLHEGADGCEIVREAQLSMDRVPPPLSRIREPKARPSKPSAKLTKPDPLIKFLDDIEMVANALGRFKTWLTAPETPKQAKPAPPALSPEETVPPFDIQEIPRAMRKEFMPVSATLMERWFAGELNYGRTSDETSAEINQNGERYPPSMYDTTTVKLDWILKHRRARDQYDALINTAIYTLPAQDVLKRILKPFKASALLDAWQICGMKQENLHDHFQFQYVTVGSSLSQKLGELVGAQFRNNGVPDDLTGSLGAFNIYASIAHVMIHREGNGTVAEVSAIYIYVKDSYDFTDKAGEVSQYLGHWGQNGVIVLAYNGAMSHINKPKLYFSYPVAMGNPKVKGNVYYPIHNKDFREWAIRHKRGGDFVIYSDRKLVRIDPPLKVYL